MGLSLVCYSCHRKPVQFQTGDLLFVEGSVSGAMEQAIMGSTGAMVHVGIVEVCHNGVFVIDADPNTGVSRRVLEDFLEAQKDKKGILPAIHPMRLAYNANLDSIVAKAKTLCGAEYDFTFLPDNGKYYCSELVYECFVVDGRSLFEAVPMNFRNAEGGFDDYWKELFDNQGLEIPQGVMGTNPDAMFRSHILKRV